MKLNIKNNRGARQSRRRLLSVLVMSVAASSGFVADDAFADAPKTTASMPTRLPSVQSSADNNDVDRKSEVNVIWQPTSVTACKVYPVSATETVASQVDRDPSLVSKPHQLDWLRSGTSSATIQVANETLDQAHAESRVGAWLSAETSAWEAIRLAAESIDQSAKESGRNKDLDLTDLASSKLHLARQAITEARDFSAALDAADPQAISRIARSHQSKLLEGQATRGLSGTDASDRYLDFSRVHLASIASHSVEAAEAMDLLAAIYLRRSDAKTLPGPTALCLRRAAIQGQPNNASLASNLGMHLTQVGLYQEAEWALKHAMAIEPNPATASALVSLLNNTGRRSEANAMIASIQRRTPDTANESKIRVPEITELTPEEFASLSKSVVWSDDRRQANTSNSKPQSNAMLASARISFESANATSETTEPTTADRLPEKPSPIQRLKNSWKRLTE